LKLTISQSIAHTSAHKSGHPILRRYLYGNR